MRSGLNEDSLRVYGPGRPKAAPRYLRQPPLHRAAPLTRDTSTSSGPPLGLLLYTDACSRGGAEQSAANLLAHLAPHIEVTVLGVDRSVVEWIASHRPGAGVVVVPQVRSKLDLPSIAAHVRAVKRSSPDILHANLTWTFSCQYAVLAALLTPGVRIVTVDQCPLPTPSRAQRFLKRAVCGRVDANVAVGSLSARMVEDVVGLPRGTVRAIYNGVPEAPLSPAPRNGSGPVVGSIGRLSPQKGYDDLVRAVAKLEGVRLVLVGDGPERRALEELAEKVGMADRFEITGWSDDARAYLPRFDVFALSSRFEGFPLVLPEAMLAGLPVVAVDVGSVSEAVLDEETGFLVRADDLDALAQALSRVLRDPAAGRRMGERGCRRARELFTAQAMARAFESLYDELCPR